MREIERKFLIGVLPAKVRRARRFQIEQGYLAIERGRQVRLRTKAGKATLTFKRDNGVARDEIEIGLTPGEFKLLWPGTKGRRLRKVRYELRWRNAVIEIDVYRG